jgi:hypothetical protein
MRTYSHNSPQAAARIVALLLIADGHVSRSEMDAVHGQHIERELGLQPGEFALVLHTLCEDLLMGMRDRRLLTGSVDDATLDALFSEVSDTDLQHKVLYFADTAAIADQHVAPAEAWVMASALKHWKPASAVGQP